MPARYVINVKQIAKFVVGLADKVAPTDIEEGMRVSKISVFCLCFCSLPLPLSLSLVFSASVAVSVHCLCL